METVKINEQKAKFIKETATKIVGEEFTYKRTFYLPIFYKLTNVMIDCNGVSGMFNGNWCEYNVEFSEESQNILGIY